MPLLGVGCSDLEQLGFLALEQGVDLVGELLGEGVQLLLRTGALVLADVALATAFARPVLLRAAAALAAGLRALGWG